MGADDVELQPGLGEDDRAIERGCCGGARGDSGRARRGCESGSTGLLPRAPPPPRPPGPSGAGRHPQLARPPGRPHSAACRPGCIAAADRRHCCSHPSRPRPGPSPEAGATRKPKLSGMCVTCRASMIRPPTAKMPGCRVRAAQIGQEVFLVVCLVGADPRPQVGRRVERRPVCRVGVAHPVTQRDQVDVVVGMQVADEDRHDIGRRAVAPEMRERALAEVEHDCRRAMLNEVAR